MALRMHRMQVAALTGSAQKTAEMTRLVSGKPAAGAESMLAVNLVLSSPHKVDDARGGACCRRGRGRAEALCQPRAAPRRRLSCGKSGGDKRNLREKMRGFTFHVGN